MEAAVAVEVPSGSAGFTCSDDLVITRLDEAGRAEQAGVELGMRVCEFMGEALPAERTWAELKKVARVTPKPWRFGFGFPPPAEPASRRRRSARQDEHDGAPRPANGAPNHQHTTQRQLDRFIYLLILLVPRFFVTVCVPACTCACALACG